MSSATRAAAEKPQSGRARMAYALAGSVNAALAAGARPIEGSTVYDLASDDAPTILREGLGPPVH